MLKYTWAEVFHEVIESNIGAKEMYERLIERGQPRLAAKLKKYFTWRQDGESEDEFLSRTWRAN